MTQIQVPAFFGIRANIDIPAGETDYKVRGSFTLPADVDAVGVWAHPHYLGKEAKLTATLPSGEVRILLWIRQWEFNWQDQYLFQDLVPLPKGTRLDGELTYDNSASNFRNPQHSAEARPVGRELHRRNGQPAAERAAEATPPTSRSLQTSYDRRTS